MKTKTIIHTAVAGITFTICGCNSNTNSQATYRQVLKNTHPNVIYILADDLGFGDVGYNGQKLIKTPNIDKMAREGMIFANHYSGSPVCAPSRCCLLTGRHTGHTQVRGNINDKLGYNLALEANTTTIATIFKDAGYNTGCFGKWGLGGPKSFAGYDHPEGHPNYQGFDEFYGYLSQGKAHWYYPKFLWHNQEQIMLDKKVYSHDLIMEKAIDFLEENQNEPFFLYVPATLPHAELQVPDDEIVEKYRSLGWPDKPYIAGGYSSQQNPHATFGAMVGRLDRDLGQIMAKLKELGLDENTLVIFTSDNGPHCEGGADPEFFDSNGIYRGHKRDLYEGGIHMPMIARWPGKIKAGSINKTISAFWDILPTCCELIGQKSLEAYNEKNNCSIDGISLLPSILGDITQQKQHDHLYWEFHEQKGKAAIRKDNWKLICLQVDNYQSVNDLYRSNDPQKVKLFDLNTNPEEKDSLNLISELAYQKTASELKEILIQERTRSKIDEFNFAWPKQ